MYQLLLIINLLCAVLLIGAVLMQQGRGAEMGSSFGRGAQGSLVGVAGTANFFSRITSLLATGFFATALALAVIGKDSTTESVIEGIREADGELVPAGDAAGSGEAGADSLPAVEGQDSGGEVPAVRE